MSKLSLSMIVKNEEPNLARCLSSVKDVADEIIVVDTGSDDRTIEIAESFNAKIFHFGWVNDFSAARNFALNKCTGDWILYLDADEELSGDSIYNLKKKINEKSAAINCIVKSLTTEKSKFGIMKYPRLFPNDTRIKFEGIVHEQIQNSLDKNKIPLNDSDIEIIHYGYILDEESANKKLERNLELLLIADDKKINHYDTLRLAQTLQGLKKFDEAEIQFKKLFNDTAVEPKLRGFAFMHFAILKYENNDIPASLDSALKAYKYIPKHAYLNYLISILNLNTDNIIKSFQHLLIAVERNQNLINKSVSPENEIISDQTDLYFRAINLAIQLKDKKDFEKLFNGISSYISSAIGVNQQIVLNSISGLLISKELNENEIILLVSIINKTNLQSFLDLLKRNNLMTVRERILIELNILFPNSAQINKNLASVYLNIDNDKAIQLFNEALKIEDDPSVYMHLISLYIGKKDYQQVKELYLTLLKNYSNIPSIRSQIEVLGEKLNHILNQIEATTIP